MTREAFIKKWLANPQKQYNEQCRDEMRDDLDKVIEYPQQQVKKLNIHDIMARLYDDVTKNSNADRSRVVAGFDKGKLCFYEHDLHEETVKRYLTTVSLNVP